MTEAARFLRIRAGSVGALSTPEENAELWVLPEENGFQALSVAGQRQIDSGQIGDDAPEIILHFPQKDFFLEADGRFLSRVKWRATEVAEQLEKKNHRPSVTPASDMDHSSRCGAGTELLPPCR